MLTKFENKSNRVKGLCFHPKRPWILASLHNGAMQLWNYQMGTKIDQFEEHDGPVRGVCFHASQPLFVSGGDDYRIKVWNYKQRRCLFTLLGHLDYIRTVEFHREYPWIVSASDDQTIRIWNWQSRNCIGVLTGHNHYVMCASFHQTDDLLVSASLDQTVRVWDITGLRKKNVRGVPNANESGTQEISADVFGNSNTVVKHVLEGHDRGVNWAAFHPTMSLIVSGADDRLVKLWRMNEVKAWEVDTLRGHMNNVSCCIFKASQDLILSNSEDRSIRVWDLSKRQCIQTFRRENDRFWIIAAHPTQNLYAAGHDSGMLVFKLHKERPPSVVHENMVYYLKERYVRRLEIRSKKDVPLLLLRSHRTGPFEQQSASLEYNPSENMLIVNYKSGDPQYMVVKLPKHDDNTSTSESNATTTFGAAVFCARNRIAVLNKDRYVVIKNLRNEMSKKCDVQAASLYYAGTGQVMLKSLEEDRVFLYDVQQRRQISSVNIAKCKFVIWAPNKQHVALMSKNQLFICDKRLNVLSQSHDPSSLKSAVWSDNGVLIYNTASHVKYALQNGDTGIIRTQNEIVYLLKVRSNNQVLVFTRNVEAKYMALNMIEATFKETLWRRDMVNVKHLIKHFRLAGKSILRYLQSKGYPEIAMLFVSDKQTKFELALECGEVEVAVETVMEMEKESGKGSKKTTKCWEDLASYAMKTGNIQVAEIAYQKTKDFQKLGFLYLISGQIVKLKKMQEIAAMTKDVSQEYRIAEYLGDFEAQAKLLAGAGHSKLAKLINWKFNPDDEELNESHNGVQQHLVNAVAFVPPFIRTTFHTEHISWPLHEKKKTELDGIQSIEGTGPPVEPPAQEEAEEGWEDDDLDESVESQQPQSEDDGEFGDGWADEGGLDLDIEEEAVVGDEIPSSDFAGKFERYPKSQQPWAVCSTGHQAELVKSLKNNFGIEDFRTLVNIMLEVQEKGTVQVPLNPFSTAGIATADDPGLPYQGELLKVLQQRRVLAFKGILKGKFADAIPLLRDITLRTLFVKFESSNFESCKELVETCKNGILLCQIQQKYKTLNLKTEGSEKARLAVIMSHIPKLPAKIQLLLLKQAVNVLFKTKNYSTVQDSCRRFIELVNSSGKAEEMGKQIKQVRTVLVRSQGKEDSDEFPNYNHSPFTICCQSWRPIFRGDPCVTDAFMGGQFCPEYSGEISGLCGITRIKPNLLGWDFLKVLI